MDIDDEVVLEVDVVTNTTDPAYLLQYPLRPRYRPYGDQGTLISGTISTESLNLSYSLNSASTNFDRSNTEYKQDTQVLFGKEIKPLTKYCVGYISEGVLSLTPFDKLFQMRPDTSYLDLILDKRQTDDKAEIEQINSENNSKKLRIYKKKEVKPVSNEKIETPLLCYDMKSAESLSLLKTLISSNSSPTTQISTNEYLSSILPTPLKSTGFRNNLSTLPISLAI